MAAPKIMYFYGKLLYHLFGADNNCGFFDDALNANSILQKRENHF